MAAGNESSWADQDLEIRTAQSDGGDRWVICDFDTSILLAIDEDGGPLRYPYFTNTKRVLQSENNGIVSVVSTLRYSSATISDMISYLKSSNIFIVHTHGAQSGFQISNTAPEFISLTDLYGEDLSNISFALLMTCYTGMNFNQSHITNGNAVNIIEQMVICGAETVIGFNDKTYVDDCNFFAPALMYYMVIEEYSAYDSLHAVDYSGYIADMSAIAEIAGNQNKKLR